MKTGKSHLWTYVVLGLLITAIAASSADAGIFGWGTRKKAANVRRQSLVVFPFDSKGVNNIPELYGEFVASDVRSMLVSNPHYLVFLYKDKLSPIRRAKDDNTLKNPDVAPPFADDKTKSLKLAQLLATEYYLVGAIDDCQIDSAKMVAQITIRADLYNAKTGKVVKSFLVTGSTPESAKTTEQDELRDMAKGVAVTKLIAELNTEKEAKSNAEPAKPAETPAPQAPANQEPAKGAGPAEQP